MPIEGGITFIDLEFDTAASGGAPLGDIASSLVSIHDLLRDLAALGASESGPQYRDIRVVNIEMRSPLTITLELRAISNDAVKAFQELGRAVILFRERRSQRAAVIATDGDAAGIGRGAAIATAMRLLSEGGGHVDITAQEIERVNDHVITLQRAEVPLKRVVVRNAGA
jgi:hypothetical protein